MLVNVCLAFDGKCEEAFCFYKSVFGKEFNYIGKFRDMPSCEGVAEEDLDKIMHVGLPISAETILMGSDTIGEQVVEGNNYSICISPDSKQQASDIFEALSVGGKVIMPLAEMFWGAYFGTLIDKFGIRWMIDYELSKN